MVGYDLTRFVGGQGALLEKLQCAVCLDVKRDAQTVCVDSHSFCRSCVRPPAGAALTACPICRGTIHSLRPDRTANVFTNDLTIRCEWAFAQHRGCEWEGRVEVLGAHEAKCPCRPVSCGHLGCSERPAATNRATHMVECRFRSQSATLARVMPVCSTHAEAASQRPAKCARVAAAATAVATTTRDDDDDAVVSGGLISSEHGGVEQECGGRRLEVPAGFVTSRRDRQGALAAAATTPAQLSMVQYAVEHAAELFTRVCVAKSRWSLWLETPGSSTRRDKRVGKIEAREGGRQVQISCTLGDCDCDGFARKDPAKGSGVVSSVMANSEAEVRGLLMELSRKSKQVLAAGAGHAPTKASTPTAGQRVLVEFKGTGWFVGTVLDVKSPEFQVHFDADGEKVWVHGTKNEWRLES